MTLHQIDALAIGLLLGFAFVVGMVFHAPYWLCIVAGILFGIGLGTVWISKRQEIQRREDRRDG
jgi:hypothetical protein